MAKITTYDFIASNTRKTALLMVLFPITLAILVYAAIIIYSFFAAGQHPNAQYAQYVSPDIMTTVNQTALTVLPIVSAIAILWIIISYFAGQKFVLSSAGATELTRANAPEVIRIVENIAITAGLPMPKVYVIDDNALNAFATGRDPKHSYVVFTKGLLNTLDKSELEGVTAHEMAHIGNRDIRLMLISIACISFATIVAGLILRYSLISGGGRNRNNRGNAQLLLLLLALVFYVYGYLIAPLIRLAVSRTREFQADATAALITRNPDGLINALKKISGNSQVEKLSSQEPLSAMCIESPLKPEKRGSFYAKLSGIFATHPPIEERIKALSKMDGGKF